MTTLFIPLFAPVLAALAAQAREEGQLLDRGVQELFAEELSGELAKEHVIAITRHHRIQGSRGYRDAAQWLLEKLRSYGFDERHAWIESFPSDGRAVYQTWQSPSGWDIEAAELRMVAPHDERIVGYPEIAMSVITYSNAGDVTAPLVWVGRGTSASDYEGKDVRGRFVLATGYGGEVHRRAVIERGAAAVVCYLDDERAAEYPDMLQYTGMWPRTEELDRVTFGFNLTNRQGERLRELCEAGEEVVLHGKVEGIGLEPYFMDVVVAVIGGTELPHEELVVSAHLDHPKESANDNASGSGAALDMARALRKLIDGGRLPAPGRTLRFLWVPEFYGTMAWIDAHPEVVGPALGGGVLGNVNMDMVGENTELLHSRMVLTRTPDSVPSVFDSVVENMAEMVDRMDVRTPRGSLSAFNWRMTPYSGGSDHMMFLDRKVPATMISHAPDYTHHTSEDTPDKVDPVELERAELIAAGTVWYLANVSQDEGRELAWLAGAKASAYLHQRARRAMALLAAPDDGDAPERLRQARSVLDHAADRARSIALSVEFYRPDAGPEAVRQVAVIQAQAATLANALQVAAGTVRAAREGPVDPRVPVRTTRGPLGTGVPELRLPEERAAWYRSGRALPGDVRFELVNWIDGERTISDLWSALSAQFGPLALEDVTRAAEDLVAAGVATWR